MRASVHPRGVVLVSIILLLAGCSKGSRHTSQDSTGRALQEVNGQPGKGQKGAQAGGDDGAKARARAKRRKRTRREEDDGKPGMAAGKSAAAQQTGEGTRPTERPGVEQGRKTAMPVKQVTASTERVQAGLGAKPVKPAISAEKVTQGLDSARRQQDLRGDAAAAGGKSDGRIAIVRANAMSQLSGNDTSRGNLPSRTNGTELLSGGKFSRSIPITRAVAAGVSGSSHNAWGRQKVEPILVNSSQPVGQGTKKAGGVGGVSSSKAMSNQSSQAAGKGSGIFGGVGGMSTSKASTSKPLFPEGSQLAGSMLESQPTRNSMGGQQAVGTEPWRKVPILQHAWNDEQPGMGSQSQVVNQTRTAQLPVEKIAAQQTGNGVKQAGVQPGLTTWSSARQAGQAEQTTVGNLGTMVGSKNAGQQGGPLSHGIGSREGKDMAKDESAATITGGGAKEWARHDQPAVTQSSNPVHPASTEAIPGAGGGGKTQNSFTGASTASMAAVIEEMRPGWADKAQDYAGGDGLLATAGLGDAATVQSGTESSLQAAAWVTSLPVSGLPRHVKGVRNMALDTRPTADAQTWTDRRGAVRQATQESWAVYEQHAMGADELTPLTLARKKSSGGLGAMIVDSLDTLWLMDLKPEFARAQQWVASELDLEQRTQVSLAETTNHIVGGLLSAFDMSRVEMFLNKAIELTDKLLVAFEGENQVLPISQVHMNDPEKQATLTEQEGTAARASIAEFGSLQMEFLALSKRTGNGKYRRLAEGIIRQIDSTYPDIGLLPVWFDRGNGLVSRSMPQELTVGTHGDFYYEYLLKMWLLKNKQDDMYRRMWERAVDEALEKLVAVSPAGLTYIASRTGDSLSSMMEHKSCFLPGNIALGVKQGAVGGLKADQYLETAEKLAYTCMQFYAQTPTGLGLEVAGMSGDEMSVMPTKKHNRLRPETVESLFYLWRTTHKEEYREWGWAIFEAIQKHCRTPEGAFANVKDVMSVPPELEDTMQSFWTAEMLKYLWLLFGADDLLDLNLWVLNTKAHPLWILRPIPAGSAS